MQKFTVLLSFLLLFYGLSQAQSQEELMDLSPGSIFSQKVSAERSPFTSPVSNSTIDALFDLQFSYNLEVVTGALGNAGGEFDGTYYYSTRWASNLLHKVDMTGNLVEEFSIAGVTGLRDLAFDGTFMYGGAAANTIFIMDFVTKTLVGTITSPIAVRHIAYDEASNGLWVGNWADPPTLIDMSGTTLATITTGLAGQYGTAYDSYSAGGPYLWVFDQGTGAGLPQFIHQFDIASGTATGVSHDVLLELGPNASAIAGGLWISEGIVPGFASIGGVLQGTPDVHFAYELATAGDPLDPNSPTNFTAFSDGTTPTSMLLTWTDPSTYVNGTPLTTFTIEIEKDGAFLASVASGTETYTDLGLTQYTEYTYGIYAKDSNDSTSSTVTATWMAGGYQPVMVVEPSAIGDTLLIGGISVHTMTIYNNLSSPGPLNYTITEDPASGWLSVSSTSGTVAPASSTELDVTLNSTGLTAGDYYAELIVEGNDPNNPADTISVTLQANESPIVSFAPDSMQFTLDPTGVAFPVIDSMTMTLSNTGQGPLAWATGGAAPELMYYKFDEAGGTQTQNFADPSSPVPQFATVNGLTMGGTGFSGAALIGAGASSGTNYVDTGWPSNLGTGSWTIEIWFNNIPTTTTLYYLFGDNTAGSFRSFIGGVAGADNIILRGGGLTDVIITGITPGPSVIQFIYDASAAEVRGYLNGVLNTTVAQGAVNVVGTAPFKVGGYSTSIGMAAGMLMDEFKMYNRAIDVTESSRQGWLTTNPQSGIVPAGGNVDIQVIADATGLIGGDYDGEVHIISNDPVHPDTSMQVRLTVFGTPQISVDPLSLAFDTLLVGASQILPVTVSNTGSFPLNVTNITTTNADFSVDTLAFQVDVGGSQVVNVTFNPQVAQAYTESMDILSDDPVNPTVTVNFTGLAIEAPVVGITPDTFDVTLNVGETETDTMTINNTGNGLLTFTVSSVLPTDTKQGKVDESLLSAEMQAAIARRSITSDQFTQPVDETTPTATTGLVLPDVIDGEEIFGSLGSTWSGATRNRGNIFSVTTATNLIEHKMFLNFAASTDMVFFVYEGTAVVGSYNKVNEVIIANSGTGQGFYSSGPISVPLREGYTYFIGAGWNGTGEYYRGTAVTPIPASFGALETGIPGEIAGGYPPAATANNTYTAFSPYYCAIVTGVGVDWLTPNPTSGIVPAGGSMDIGLTFDPTGLVGGDYYANVLVESNDPVNPQVEAGAHMLLIGQAAVGHSPSVVTMDTIFTGATDSKSLFVKNTGSDTLRVTGITSTNPLFTVSSTAFTVAPPLDSVEVMVTFSPLVVGTETGYLLVASNDPVTPVDSVDVIGVAVEAPVAVINAQFSNPVQVNEGDSVDIFINVSNSGGSALLWSASLSNAPGSMAAYGRPLFGPVEGSGYADLNPDLQSPPAGMYLDAMWDLQFSYNLEVVTGALGNAGGEFDGMYYYSTRWASNLLHKVDMTGNLVEEFSIAGVTGLRDLAFDGTFMYGGAAANTVYIMDFASKTLIGTIPSPVGVRNISYDEANNGLWLGNWADPPTLIDMSGTTLATLTTGLAGQYGAAYDGYSAGGPYLWVFDQGAGAGTPQIIHQFDLNTLTATGMTYDVTLDFPTSAGIAGGLWVGDGVVAGTASIGGVLQGTPDNFFVYELAVTAAPWISLLANSGSISPGDQFDLPVRVYGVPSTEDTAYVIILTNDPSLPMADVMVIRDLITGIGDQETLPTTYDIAQNYPNPFNPTTTIKYQLPQVSDVKLVIYNVLGQKVRTLVNNRMEAGYHSLVWDGLNQQGSTVASGVYIYHFEAGDFQKTMKLMLLK